MKGNCLCGGVSYEITPPFSVFQYCHCSRCRRVSGSAHSANLFVPVEQFQWLTGADLVGRFEPVEAKYFATGFCTRCGSALPWQVRGGRNMVIPAGTLDEDPGVRPQQSIHWSSHACWYVSPAALPAYDELPPRG